MFWMLTFQGKLVPLVNFFPIRALPINRNMDAQAKKKALFRAKLNAQKKEKRIESPLVRLVLGAHHVIFAFPYINLLCPSQICVWIS